MTRKKCPGVAAATDHMTDAPGATATKVDEVRRLVGERMERFNVRHSFLTAPIRGRAVRKHLISEQHMNKVNGRLETYILERRVFVPFRGAT